MHTYINRDTAAAADTDSCYFARSLARLLCLTLSLSAEALGVESRKPKANNCQGARLQQLAPKNWHRACASTNPHWPLRLPLGCCTSLTVKFGGGWGGAVSSKNFFAVSASDRRHKSEWAAATATAPATVGRCVRNMPKKEKRSSS